MRERLSGWGVEEACITGSAGRQSQRPARLRVRGQCSSRPIALRFPPISRRCTRDGTRTTDADRNRSHNLPDYLFVFVNSMAVRISNGCEGISAWHRSSEQSRGDLIDATGDTSLAIYHAHVLAGEDLRKWVRFRRSSASRPGCEETSLYTGSVRLGLYL